MMPLRSAAVLLVSLLAAGGARGATTDTVFLKDGDRVTGTVSGPGSKGYRVQTPYGRLVIPKDKIDRIVYDDGREEVVASSTPGGGWTQSPLKLELAVTGDSFWHAWDPREAPVDPALRLVLLLDDEPIAAYLDRQVDPDIPGAVVNTFAFAPSDTSRTLWNRTRAQPPEVTAGRVALKLEVTPPKSGERRLRIKYQCNLGAVEDPVWTDLVESAMTFRVDPANPTVIQINQSRGKMSFGGILRKKRMRGVESFTLRVATEKDGETTVIVPTAP